MQKRSFSGVSGPFGAQDPKDKLELKENVDSGVYVKDLTTFVVKSAMEIDHVMQASHGGQDTARGSQRQGDGKGGTHDGA